MRSGPITLLTDFGMTDPFVGIMKGVILSVCREAIVIDLTHAVPPQDVRAGALLLRAAVGVFPPGTIHVAVVDPGVGSVRRPILIETERGTFVGPDNGVLSLAVASLGGGRARVIENQRYFHQPVSQTFHGRDIFAPVAAHLACGVRPAEIGSPIDSIVELTIPLMGATDSGLVGQVLYADHFGNLITNIAGAAIQRFANQRICVSIAGKRVAGPMASYADVPEGEPLAIIDSWDMLEVAVRNGSAAKKFAAGPGTPVTVVLESRDV